MVAYVFVLNMFGLDRLSTYSCRAILGAFAKHLLIVFFMYVLYDHMYQGQFHWRIFVKFHVWGFGPVPLHGFSWNFMFGFLDQSHWTDFREISCLGVWTTSIARIFLKFHVWVFGPVPLEGFSWNFMFGGLYGKLSTYLFCVSQKIGRNNWMITWVPAYIYDLSSWYAFWGGVCSLWSTWWGWRKSCLSDFDI